MTDRGANSMLAFLVELRRRNVLRVAAAYLVAAWLLVQVAATLLPLFGFGEGAVLPVVVLLAVGFVPALVFSWAFEITPEGLKRERDVDRERSIVAHTGRKIDRIIMVVLSLALGYFVFDRFVLSPSREAAGVQSARQEGRSEALVESYGDRSIAVLPFVDMSPGHDQEYLSDGIAEELLNLLAKIPELRVISRSSAFSFKDRNLKIPKIARQLNVAHILEGSVRRDGNRVRITAQLIDARSDTHLWSETYDRTMGDIFAVQDEVAAAVVEQLKLKLLGATPTARVVNPEAYALEMKARFLGREGSNATLEQSVDFPSWRSQSTLLMPRPGLNSREPTRVSSCEACFLPSRVSLCSARPSPRLWRSTRTISRPTSSLAGLRYAWNATSQRLRGTCRAPSRWTRRMPTRFEPPRRWPMPSVGRMRRLPSHGTPS